MQKHLRKLYNKNLVGKAFFDHMASRQRSQSETTVDRTHQILKSQGCYAPRNDIIKLFRELEQIGCGKFKVGRRGRPSRFVWNTNVLSVSRLAREKRPRQRSKRP